MRLRLNQIRLDGGTQLRERLVPTIIEEYRPHYRQAEVALPAPVVFRDEAGDHWLADGFHRYHAAAQELPTEGEIECDVRQGTKRDAQLYAAAANESHGLRRTAADRRRAAELLLRDPEWTTWSDREIARAIKVDSRVVGEVRARLAATGEIPQLETRQGKDGKVRKLPAKRAKEQAGGEQAVDAGGGDLRGGAGGLDGSGGASGSRADGQGADAGAAVPGGDVHRSEGGAVDQDEPGAVERAADVGAQVNRVEPAPTCGAPHGIGRLRCERSLGHDGTHSAMDGATYVRWDQDGLRSSTNAPMVLHDPPAATQSLIDAERDGYRRGLEEGEAAAKAAYKQGQEELLQVVAEWTGLTDDVADSAELPDDLRGLVEERIAELRMDSRSSCATCKLREAELQQTLGRAWPGLANASWVLLAGRVAEMVAQKQAAVTPMCPARTDESAARTCDAHATPPDPVEAARRLGTEHAEKRRRPWAGKGDELDKLLKEVGAGKVSVSRKAAVYAAYKEAFDAGKAASKAARDGLLPGEKIDFTGPRCAACGEAIVPNRMCPARPMAVCAEKLR